MPKGILATLVFLVSVTASAGTAAIDRSLSPEAQGLAIASESERRQEGFGDTVTELVMTLRNDEGRERRRRLTWKTLEITAPGVGDRSLTVFHEPRDIAGTAFLSHTYIDREDDQWLYLPALKRVKRIPSANKSSSFVGSEFSYEDLLADEVEKFDYRWLRDESCGELSCFVVERIPRYDESGYSRQVVWIDHDEFRPLRIEFFDKEGDHQKTLLFDDYRRYLDRFWRPHRMAMMNHQTAKETVLSFSDYEFWVGLTERDFDPAVLRGPR